MKLRVIALLALLASAGSLAPAQSTPAGDGKDQRVRIQPPVPQREENPTVFMYYVVVVLLAGGAVGAACIPTKRGHQD